MTKPEVTFAAIAAARAAITELIDGQVAKAVEAIGAIDTGELTHVARLLRQTADMVQERDDALQQRRAAA